MIARELQDKLCEARDVLCGIDAEDMPRIARARGYLNDIATSDSIDDDARSLSRHASALSVELERLILRDTENAEALLTQVREHIAELLNLVVSGPRVLGGVIGPALEDASIAGAGGHRGVPEATAPALEEAAIGEGDAPLAREFVIEAIGHLETAERALLAMESRPADADSIGELFRAFHTIKGVSGCLNLRQIGAVAHVSESLLALAREGQLVLDSMRIDVLLRAVDCLRHLIEDTARAVEANRPPAQHDGLRELLRTIETASVNQLGGSEHVKPHASAPTHASVSAMAELPAASEAASNVATATGDHAPGGGGGAEQEVTRTGQGVGETTVKVSTQRLDKLVNMVGELLVAQSMVKQDTFEAALGDPRVARSLGHLSKITRELQDLSMAMRMVPVAGVFQKMARLVRDVSRKAGKQVEFVVSGGETELDRNMVEALADPLTHMVRNSVDHGIEPPDGRAAAGKAMAGRLELRAFHEAGRVVVQVIDDGRGLPREKILKKAIAAGVVSPGTSLSDEQIDELIFHPGLSTAEKVTEISGRGVGMDVVRKNVESLRGRIEISTTPGRGTTFTMRLPLTLAMIDGMVVRVADQRYIIPITSIEQSMRPRPEQISTIAGVAELCTVRGRTLPLVRLADIFGLECERTDPSKGLVVIVHDEGRACCLLVDAIVGQQQVVIKSLGEALGEIPGVSGGAILGDGAVSLILDVSGLISSAAQGGPHS